MACKAQAMANKSLDTLVNLNSKLARKVGACGDEVDTIYQQMCWIVQEATEADPIQIESLLLFSLTSLLLADLVNVCGLLLSSLSLDRSRRDSNPRYPKG